MSHSAARKRLWRGPTVAAGRCRPQPGRGSQVDYHARRSEAGATVTDVNQLKVKLFADGADKSGMLEMYAKPYIKGFTTNPTLMRKVGIADYEVFAKDILAAIPDRPISFEVFADEFAEMERQARRITTWGKHVSVKIPITNSARESAIPLVRRLAQDGIGVKVTAMFPLG